MSHHCVLTVLRAENVVWDRKFRSDAPSLYVKVTLGGEVRRTRTIKKSLSPNWNDQLTWQLPDTSRNADVLLELKHSSRLRINTSVGAATTNLESLMEEAAKGDVKLELRLASSTVTGVIFLRLSDAKGKEAAQIAVRYAGERVDATLANSRASEVVSTAGNVNSQIDAQQDLVESVKGVLGTVGAFVKVMDEVAAIHPYANAVWQVLSSVYHAVENQVQLDEQVVKLVQTMKEIFDIVNNLDGLKEKLRTSEYTISVFLKQSYECSLFIQKYTRKGFMGRLLTAGDKQKIEEFEGKFAELKAAFTSQIAVSSAVVTGRMSELVDLTFLRQELDPAKMDASSRSKCLPGTRKEYLDNIMKWILTDTETNVLWLHGVAGSGKSTISMSIAEECFSTSRRGAHLFFTRGKSNPSEVIRTIAFQLASFDSNIAENVRKAVKENSGVASLSLGSQFRILLAEPLAAAADAMTGPVVIILDALDECGIPSEREKLLKIFSGDIPKLPSVFRFIFTGRPESDIIRAFTLPSIKRIEVDFSSNNSRNDVSRYIDFELCDVLAELGLEPAARQSWYRDMKVLSNAANGLFIWASTAIKWIRLRSGDPLGALDELVSYCQEGSFGLCDLYDTVLSKSGIPWNRDSSRERFVQIIGLILLSKTPLSIAAIDGILGFSATSSSRLIVERLQSVLVYTPIDSDAPIRLFHASFSDYLLSPELRNQDWYVDIQAQRALIAMRCFDIMANDLRFNICNLESSFLRNADVPDIELSIKISIPLHLEYACRFWSVHLCEVSFSSAPSELLTKLSLFAKHCLPYWLEVLSLTNHLRHEAGRSLLYATLWTATSTSDVSSFLWSAYRLVSRFVDPISTSVPHIYLSALSLAKGESIVADHYAERFPGIRIGRVGIKPLQPCIKVFDMGHNESVTSVTFSPDGRRIASGSWDETILIWDAESGEISKPITGHAGAVTALAFSPNSTLIASASNDGTIRVQYAESGMLYSDPFEGHTGPIFSIAFSPDGMKVVSCSENRAILLWDIRIRKPICDTFSGCSGNVHSVAFAPNGKHVASGSDDGSILVWNVESGKPVLGPFKEHVASVTSVVYSPDGKRLASASYDETVRIWNIESEKSVFGPLEGHRGPVTSVTYSPDGKRIASASEDGTVRVWEVESGKVVSGPFQGHTDSVTSVAFSPDGKRVVSGSKDGTIRVWDADSGRTVVGRSAGWVRSLAVSSNGRCIASALGDETVRVWDVGYYGLDTTMRRKHRSGLETQTENGTGDLTPYALRESIHEGKTMSSILDDLGITSNWIMSDDGWLLGKGGELLLWIPPDDRETLWQPSNTAVFSTRFSTRVDFTGCKIGDDWHDGYPLKEQD